ncbi:MAG: GTP-binding protein [Nitrospirae bacterium]|nr:GTP-binding protein [Candidatus Manganitrophaceae bacterium]
MTPQTPIVILTGYLGSGKTTLLRRVVDLADRRLAIVMNEFGALAVDSQVVAGEKIRIAELEGGCVCCSLLGDFDAAVKELIETVRPDEILLETTGLAEPDGLIAEIEENLPALSLHAVVAVVDADATLRFPSIGQTGRIQIEAADLILLNKIDLIDETQHREVRERVRAIQPAALLLETVHCQVDPGLILGRPLRTGFQWERRKRPEAHRPPMQSFELRMDRPLDRICFEAFVVRLPDTVYRAKGFIPFEEGIFLFNFVAGRSELIAFPKISGVLGLVFIGEKVLDLESMITTDLAACAAAPDPH